MSDNKIFSAISAVMADINAVEKKGWNKEQKFSFRSIDDIVNELHSIFVAHKIFVIPEVVKEERSERITKTGAVLFSSRLTVKYTLVAEDGSTVSSVVMGEAMDAGDKATTKALSIAYKYMLLEVFCIPTEDQKDPDSESYDDIAPEQQAEAEIERKKKEDAERLRLAEIELKQKKFINEMKALKDSKLPDGSPVFSTAESWAPFSSMAKTHTMEETISATKAEVQRITDEFDKDIPF
ncbi:ERF superfamily protein [uncultured archaeon]|nr:ERF superfamily protein [uncultured archaeon]